MVISLYRDRNNISPHTGSRAVNDRLIEILSERPDFTLSVEIKSCSISLRNISIYGSLFLAGFEPGSDPIFIFTNDAQRYRFAMSEIRGLVQGMKRGIAVDWERISFELEGRPIIAGI